MAVDTLGRYALSDLRDRIRRLLDSLQVVVAALADSRRRGIVEMVLTQRAVVSGCIGLDF